MPSASQLRAGLVFVEMGIDRAFLKAELDKAQAQVAQMAASMNKTVTAGAAGVGGAAGGPGLWGMTPPLMIQGMRAYTAISLLRSGVTGLTTALRDDYNWADAVDSMFESLPVGVGEFYKGIKDLRGELSGTAGAFREFTAAAAVRATMAEAQKAVEEMRHALQMQAALIGASPYEALGIQATEERRKILAMARTKGLEEPQVQGLLEDLDERQRRAQQKLSDDERNRNADTYLGLLGKEHDEWAKLTTSAEEYLAYQVAQIAHSGEEYKEIFGWRLKNLHITEQQKAAEAAIRDTIRQEAEIEADVKREKQELLDVVVNYVKQTKSEAESIRQSVETPTERFRREKQHLEELRIQQPGVVTPEVYSKAIQKALEDAAAALPDETLTHRGTFWGMEAAMGMSGGGDALTHACQKTAEYGEKSARLLQKLADEGTPLVWNN